MEKKKEKIFELKAIVNPDRQLGIKKADYCPHTYTEIDTDEKILRCQKCNAIIFPYDYVYQLACKETNLLHHLKGVETKIKELHEVKDRLEKDVNNLKSIKRKLSK